MIKRTYASSWWYRLWFKEVKKLVLCPHCGQYTSYSNHFVPRLFGDGDVWLNPTPLHWSVTCRYCHTPIKFKVMVVESKDEFKLEGANEKSK